MDVFFMPNLLLDDLMPGDCRRDLTDGGDWDGSDVLTLLQSLDLLLDATNDTGVLLFTQFADGLLTLVVLLFIVALLGGLNSLMLQANSWLSQVMDLSVQTLLVEDWLDVGGGGSEGLVADVSLETLLAWETCLSG